MGHSQNIARRLHQSHWIGNGRYRDDNKQQTKKYERRQSNVQQAHQHAARSRSSVEYALIIFLVAVAAIVIPTTLGKQIATVFFTSVTGSL